MLLLITALLVALAAGVFFAWSCSVTPGLGKVDDYTYLAAMQSMNRKIQNPVFFTCFFGAAILLPVCTYMNYQHPATIHFCLLLAAAFCYLTGVMGVTIVGNIPLNNKLDMMDLKNATAAQMAGFRAGFESVWNLLNNIRTIAATVSLLLVLIACVYGNRQS